MLGSPIGTQVTVAFSERLFQLFLKPQKLVHFLPNISELAGKQASHLGTRVVMLLIQDRQLLDFGQGKPEVPEPSE